MYSNNLTKLTILLQYPWNLVRDYIISVVTSSVVNICLFLFFVYKKICLLLHYC